MIAMQYTVRLAGDFSGQQVRDRVEKRRCLFDDLPGLLHKSFLYNKGDGLYAPFYVWAGDGAARKFLTGNLFQELVEMFGRPRVRCWAVLTFAEYGAADAARYAVKESEPIAAETKLENLICEEEQRHAAAGQSPGIGCHLVGIDPDRWELMRYSTWTQPQPPPICDADMVQIYEILHLSRPVVSS